MSARRLLLLGPPGVGKGTQALRLARELSVPQISTGDMLRDAVARKSEVGKCAKNAMEQGELVADEIVIRVARERLTQDDACAGFILDGFPRTHEQARALDEMLGELGTPLERCVAITAEEGVLVERLLERAITEGRSDDNEATIRNRMQVYHEETAPLASYYSEQGLLRDVDGTGSIEEVADRIQGALQ